MLIEKVRQRTFLYHTKSPDYRDQHMRANAWKGTGKEMKIKRKFCVSSRDVRIVCSRLYIPVQPVIFPNVHCKFTYLWQLFFRRQFKTNFNVSIHSFNLAGIANIKVSVSITGCIEDPALLGCDAVSLKDSTQIQVSTHNIEKDLELFPKRKAILSGGAAQTQQPANVRGICGHQVANYNRLQSFSASQWLCAVYCVVRVFAKGRSDRTHLPHFKKKHSRCGNHGTTCTATITQ